MFAFIGPLLSGFGWAYRIGSAVLAGLGLGQVLDLFDGWGNDDKKQAETLVGLVGVLFLGVLALLVLMKKKTGVKRVSYRYNR